MNSEKTAISRKKASVPTRDLYQKNLIVGNVLDFGCGKGKDLDFLLSKNVFIDGYDKYYHPHCKFKTGYDTIVCNYVLNVISDLSERINVIKQIINLLKPNGIAYITTRTDNDIHKSANEKWTKYNDGFKTTKGTFQKGYNVNELKSFVSNIANDMMISVKIITMTKNIKSAKYSQVSITKL